MRFSKIKEKIIYLLSKTWVVCLFTLILLTLILFCRKPDAFLNPQFWAEDGVVFFKENHDYGLKSLIMPYSGYMHTVPRIVALIASWFPVVMAPAIYNYLTLATLLIVAGSLFSSRCFIPLKPLIALSIVLVPHTGEVFMNVTSIQWFLCLLILILLFKEHPYKLHHYIFDYLIVLVCGLTGPFIVFLFPLFIGKYLIKKTSHNLGILLAVLSCVFTQIWFFYHTFISQSDAFAGNFYSWINILGIKLFARLFLIDKIYVLINPVILAICSLLFPIYLIWQTNTKKNLYMIISFMYFGLVVLASGIYKYRELIDVFAYHINNGDRYFYIFYIMVFWSLVVSMTSKSIFKRQSATVLIILIFFSTAQYFRSAKYVDYHWKNYVKKIESGDCVRVPINPPGWFFDLGDPNQNLENDAQESNENEI